MSFSGLLTVEAPEAPVTIPDDSNPHNLVAIASSDSGSEETDPEGEYELFESEDADQPPPHLELHDYYLVNNNKGTFHVVVECEESHPRSLASSEFQGIFFRTGCASKPASWELSASLPIGYTACEGGCRGRLDKRRN